VPGLIDAHLHLSLGAESMLEVDLSACRDRAAFEQAIAAGHAALPPGAWLVARGWNEDAFPARVPPDRSWLAAAGSRPAIAWRMDSHACVANDAVLARLDLAADPPGGRIGRDANGRPDGLLQEAAAWTLVQPLVPPLEATRRLRAVADATRFLASLGLTAVGSMEYRRMLEEGLVPQRDSLAVRVRATLLDRDFHRRAEWRGHLAFARSFPNDDRLAIIGMKAFLDGTLGSRTARMLADYADDSGNRGLLVEMAERGELPDWIREVRAAGLSPAMHAIGDEAARLALEAAEASDGAGDAPVRLEHAQTVERGDLARFRGRIASMQPLHKAYDARTAPARLGVARLDRFFRFRSLRDSGATLAFGSDWPIVSPCPIRSMHAAITGLDVDGNPCRTEESLAPAEALEAHTRGAARCLGARDLGDLEPGFRADLTILDRDPVACDWSREPPRVLATVMDGRFTFAAADAPFDGTIRATLPPSMLPPETPS
jgi:predicted amidohydrolase YtcJ